METLNILVIAVGLAMDAFAVSVASGFTLKDLKVNKVLTIALFFGAFQAIMPVLGWLSGIGLKSFIAGIDHWVAFVLLVGIGIKMIYEALRFKKKEKHPNSFNLYILFILAVVTSIDAFAVGISFAFLKISILTPVLIIGLVTFVLSFSGAYLGKKFGHLFESKIEILGGIILIVIAFKILFEDLGML
ncbi:MAG: manganese efflux pump [Ignavibacteria bacterium]|nr:manganese efflux pump [Ignavibacteria bacterium]